MAKRHGNIRPSDSRDEPGRPKRTSFYKEGKALFITSAITIATVSLIVYGFIHAEQEQEKQRFREGPCQGLNDITLFTGPGPFRFEGSDNNYFVGNNETIIVKNEFGQVVGESKYNIQVGKEVIALRYHDAIGIAKCK